MKKLFFLLLLIPCIGFSQYLKKEVAHLFDAFNKYRDFQGTVLVAKGDQVIFSNGYGFADEEKKIKNSFNTQFRIASVSKQFTAAIILKLEETGRLSVNDPIRKYVSDFIFGDSIRIHHLLSHMSGIPDITGLPGFVK